MGQGCSRECFTFIGRSAPSTKRIEAPENETVMIIGGGIAGLVAAYKLCTQGKHVILAEKSDRFGGQIDTIECAGIDLESPLIIEQGAEGFVSRSTCIPEIARQLGISDDIIDQGALDNMVYENGTLRLVPAGESAAKLGFQVDKKHFGKGLKTFRRGLGQLVMALVDYLEVQPNATLHLRCPVDQVDKADSGDIKSKSNLRHSTSSTLLKVSFSAKSPHAPKGPILCHKIIAACSAKAIAHMFAAHLGPIASKIRNTYKATQNLNVNLVFQKSECMLEGVPHSSGFIIPEEDQPDRLGLRAISFSFWKFPTQMKGPLLLFRAHFRPVPGVDDANRYVNEAKRVLAEALPDFEVNPMQAWLQRWPDSLIERNPPFLESIEEAKEHLRKVFQGRVELVGSSIGNAGVDGAVESAFAGVARFDSAEESALESAFARFDRR